jgi:sterol desaturase/sphingolipid hydroxylase (fatty acid hydroxylase superfamily)
MTWPDFTWSEPTVRLTAFLAVFAAMAMLEAVLPRRRRVLPRVQRWVTNLTFVGLGALVVRGLGWIAGALAVPLVAVAAAAMAARYEVGLLNWLAWPAWLEIVVALVILDFAIWFQHWAAHAVPGLWRVHRMHHADRDFDVTTALRFHPIEIGLSMLWKVVVVLALGAPVAAVIAFEVILNALAMFNHANVALPSWLDRGLRLLVVTPDMHRVHHSVHQGEHHANFGFNLSIWDRLFRTYVAQPRDGHEGMTIGLSAYQADAAPARLGWSLALPFRDPPCP